MDGRTAGPARRCTWASPASRRRMSLWHLFSCLTLSLSAMKPCHSYLMILFKMPGLSSGPQMAQEGLHSFLCPSGVTALCDMLRVHSGSNIHFPGRRAGLLARGQRASKARMSPRGKSFPAPPRRKCLWCEQTPGQTRRMQRGSLFLLHISLSDVCQNYLLRPPNIKGFCVVGGWGRWCSVGLETSQR